MQWADAWEDTADAWEDTIVAVIPIYRSILSGQSVFGILQRDGIIYLRTRKHMKEHFKPCSRPENAADYGVEE